MSVIIQLVVSVILLLVFAPRSLVFNNISCELYIEKVFLSLEIFFIIFQNKLQKSVKELQAVLLRFVTIQRTGKKSQIIESLSISATDKAGIYAKLTMMC